MGICKKQLLFTKFDFNLTHVKFFKTADQMPDPKVGQMNLQEELRLQMEDKKRRAAAEKAREREEEAKLERRIQEQQDRMRKEFEEEQAKKKAKEQAVSPFFNEVHIPITYNSCTTCNY